MVILHVDGDSDGSNVISGDGKNDMVMVMILVGLVTFKVKVVT